MTSDLRKVISVTEFLNRGYCSRPTLYSLLHRGELRAMKIGKSTKIFLDSIDEWVARSEAAAEAKLRRKASA